MRTENINNQIFAAKISYGASYKVPCGIPYRAEEKTVSNEEKKDVLKPLEKDTVTFTKRQKREKAPKAERDGKMPAFLHSFYLNLGQKRVQKLEEQARKIKEDAEEAMGFSYVGSIMSHSREIITDGIETNGDRKTTAQIYSYKDGRLIKAELGIEEHLKEGTKNTRQIFEFDGGELSAVYENVVESKDGITGFKRKFKADEKGSLKCVYNKVF